MFSTFMIGLRTHFCEWLCSYWRTQSGSLPNWHNSTLNARFVQGSQYKDAHSFTAKQKLYSYQYQIKNCRNIQSSNVSMVRLLSLLCEVSSTWTNCFKFQNLGHNSDQSQWKQRYIFRYITKILKCHGLAQDTRWFPSTHVCQTAWCHVPKTVLS